MKSSYGFFWAISLLLLAGTANATPFKLTSSAFSNGGTLPEIYTCDGENVSPALSWQGAPALTKSYALIVTDYDAIYSLRKYMQHWSVYDLPANVTSLSKAQSGLFSGVNSYGAPGYRGPCPPAGTTHRYSFQLYALDIEHLTLTNPTPTATELLQAMQGHLLDQTLLIGTYTRPMGAVSAK